MKLLSVNMIHRIGWLIDGSDTLLRHVTGAYPARMCRRADDMVCAPAATVVFAVRRQVYDKLKEKVR